jgi:hypothetical protein
LDFSGSSTIAGAKLLTIAAGATVRFDHPATISGSVTVDGTFTLVTSPVTLAIAGTLTLDAAGVLNNSDTISVGAFVNNGGTINGNAPVVGGGAPQLVHIDRIQVAPPSGPGTHPKSLFSPGTVILTWHATAGLRFAVETGPGWGKWTSEFATVVETGPGSYQATVKPGTSQTGFYRLRYIPALTKVPQAPN